MQIERIGTTKDRLGEALTWDAASQRLYWADALEGVVRRLDPGTGAREDFRIPAPLGTLCPTCDDRLVLCLSDGAYLFDPAAGVVEPYAKLPGKLDGVRLNDGKTDRQGRLVVGSLHLAYKTETAYKGKFYTLGPDRVFRAFDDGVGITNGPCFSPAGDVLYIADSAKKVIWAFDYDTATGRPSGKRVLADDAVLEGMPDGATVDSDGCLWFTVFTRGAIVRLSPQGKLLTTVEMPVTGVTNVTFGGRGLDVLYATSLSQSVNIDTSQEGAGGLFAITGLGVMGVPEARFIT